MPSLCMTSPQLFLGHCSQLSRRFSGFRRASSAPRWPLQRRQGKLCLSACLRCAQPHDRMKARAACAVLNSDALARKVQAGVASYLRGAKGACSSCAAGPRECFVCLAKPRGEKKVPGSFLLLDPTKEEEVPCSATPKVACWKFRRRGRRCGCWLEGTSIIIIVTESSP